MKRAIAILLCASWWYMGAGAHGRMYPFGPFPSFAACESFRVQHGGSTMLPISTLPCREAK